MSEENKVNKQRVITALKNWSPNGLCGGTLVQKNGDPKATEACAIGCLALDFACSKSGQKFFKKIDRSPKFFIKKHLYGKLSIQETKGFKQAMNDYYGLTDTMHEEIMSYNDSCVENGGRTRDDGEGDAVPSSVRKTIFSLRKRFDKFEEKRFAAEDAQNNSEYGDE